MNINLESMTLREIISAVNGAVDDKLNSELVVNKISTDTREEIKNSLYIAIVGENFDGHDFVSDAIAGGAVAVIIDKEIDVKNEDLDKVIKVEDTKKALLDIAGYYRDKFAVIMVGITGSVGKTTTKEMVASVFEQKYTVLKTQNNLNNEIGVSKTLLKLDKGYKAGVLEMGMCDVGEISELSSHIKPDIGIVTKIGVSHIERLGSRENIFKSKIEIIDGMRKGSILILNGDDEYLGKFNNNDYRIIYYGIENIDSDVYAANILQEGFTTIFDIVDGEKRLSVTIPCIGVHNVYNALAAYISGKIAHISDDMILKGLEEYKPSGMRQKINIFNGTTIVEDCYNASPDSMKAALKTLSEMNSAGKKIAVLSDMLELGNVSDDEHFKIGKFISECKIDKLYCVGDKSKLYVKGAVENGFGESFVTWTETKDLLIDKLKLDIDEGDIVWFKASRGMKLEGIISKIYEDVE